MAAGACVSPTKAQYVIFNTSGGGDPINASSPGTYEDSNIIHSPTLGTASIALRGTQHTAGAPWGTLPQNVLDRTQFWHIMTNTPVHPKEPQVLELMGAAPANEMLPSLLAKTLGPLPQHAADAARRAGCTAAVVLGAGLAADSAGGAEEHAGPRRGPADEPAGKFEIRP